MTKIEASKRLVTRVKAAAEGKFVYDDGFKKIWRPVGCGGMFRTKAAGTITVDVVDPETEGNLQHDVPSVEVSIGGKKQTLTWNEAYNLAHILNEAVATAYYG